ncbi:hypothetical protein FC19_GL000742 [Liquorilactobacillus aquaticus DSM 21051]|uniref:Uncharacterized protein n=1 Tax=Liquorilactobacillus aquaticus DSM 21051 TaxID=1423725 RepID=A0A0R2CYT8_9LACO|nr:hypothetical protein [Liquorilactobacillus aquaticus]KRM96450.1 hypothetical protein FC19_GL000742 [Liquorilactobacillus aquaticus DSM 21051]
MVKEYIQQANDLNPLHVGLNKIVPGNLLVDQLENYCMDLKKTALKHLKIKFIKSLRTNERIMIEISGKSFNIKRIQHGKAVLVAFGSWE